MSIRRKLARRVWRIGKVVYQAAGVGKTDAPVVAFVFGCQRLGTSMLIDIFDYDMRSRVFREKDSVFDAMRLKPLPSVMSDFQKCATQFVVAKPLLDSQRALEVLEYFPESTALWIYRHYRAVAHSNIRRFGVSNGMRDLRPLLEGNTVNWRSEGVSPRVRERVAALCADDPTPYDAAALFWYVRNCLFFDQSLHEHSRTVLCKYENIVNAPENELRRLYCSLGIRLPGRMVVREVHRGAMKKGMDIELSPEVEVICEELWRRLEEDTRERLYPSTRVS